MSSTDKDVQVQCETQETPESHLLLVNIPDGFAREHIGAKVEYDFGRVRVYGEKPLGNNKSSRFDERYKVPAHCDISRVRGRFDGKTITIIMPKIPGLVPETTEQEPPKPAVQETQPNQGNDKDETPQQSAIGDDKEKATASEVKDQKGTQEGTSSEQDPKSTIEGKEEGKDHEASTSTSAPEATEESLPQKGTQEATPQNATATRDAKLQTEAKSADENKKKEKAEKEESLPQKGTQEPTPQNATATRDAKLQTEAKSADENKKKEKAEKEESLPQKGTQEPTPQNATATRDAKLQTEATSVDENKEKVEKEEIKDNPNNKTSEKGNTPEEKAVVADSSPTPEKESKEERKESSMVESSLPKSTEKVKGKEINGKSGADENETKSDKKAMVESTRTKIKEKASSAYQALTSMTNRFNEEDKQKLIYMGAAVVVLTLSVYASYKFRSSRRP
ncbi:inactive protein RESTRICTED TEV MOVEMENT 2-like [Lotus japonicus]|uniref:inactive protein RESTRICTED TEV MOVEMENT 2-like n=1 Tax=Lotus japonicus TaxID=34305 RepID=UPI002585B2A5|nr:inactive protein RESTRICTED TEV MOVEMENT 2-like [Lotus japonicus]